MKLFAVIISIVLPASMTFANPVAIPWSMAHTPSAGLKDITFPINIANAPHVSGYYFAQQFAFNGANTVGYTGLQPRPDQNGSSIVHGVFSSFINGTTSSPSDPNCHSGADGGPGVSCAVEIASSYSHTYNLLVENVSGTTWTGTMIDTVTGVRTRIGTFTLPAGTSGIQSSQVGFVEYYLWNLTPGVCSTLPKTSVFFGTPSTSTSGAGPGSQSDAYEYGDCIGEADFVTSRNSSGVAVTIGFVQSSRFTWLNRLYKLLIQA